MIKIEADQAALDRAIELLDGVPNGIQRALVSSFNRALLEGRTAGTRQAVGLYTLKSGIVRKTMAMHRANKNNLNAELVSRGRRLPMRYYAHKPGRDTTGSKQQQVSVAVRKGALKPVGQGFIYNGMVMQRVGSSRLPVTQLYSLSVPNILDNEQVVDAIQDRMRQAVRKRLAHETERLLKGY